MLNERPKDHISEPTISLTGEECERISLKKQTNGRQWRFAPKGAPIRLEERIHSRSRVKECVSRVEGLGHLTVSLKAKKGLTPTLY
jgi:hypothetical protein